MKPKKNPSTLPLKMAILWFVRKDWDFEACDDKESVSNEICIIREFFLCGMAYWIVPRIIMVLFFMSAPTNPFAMKCITRSFRHKNSILRMISSSNIQTRVQSFIQNECKISSDELTYILLCVSGGLDSMAMLHLMASLKNTTFPKLHLEVINFNHKVRPESDEEVNCNKTTWACRFVVNSL